MPIESKTGSGVTAHSSLKQYVYNGEDEASPSRHTIQAKSTPPTEFHMPPSSTSKRKTPSSPLNSTATPSPSPKKRKRVSAGYVPSSKYAHICNLLTDSLTPNLICVFIGVNPGVKTATSGHAYAHPSNLFWKLAHKSGCTPRLCRPQEDQDLPRLYALGHTNIVARVTKDASELSAQEMDDGVAVLEEKIRRFRPECVCLVGKSIWETLFRVRHGRKIRKEEFRYGWQDEGENMGVVEEGEGGGEWTGARLFVATTTSGLAAGMRPHEKEEVWRGLGDFVEKRRRERGIPEQGGKAAEG